jgi:hypothetical protein
LGKMLIYIYFEVYCIQEVSRQIKKQVEVEAR